MNLLQVLHVLAALIVLAEALNKLERTAPLARGLRPRQRLVAMLKAIAWMLLALGAGGELVAPVFPLLGVQAGLGAAFLGAPEPPLSQTAVLLGFAVLIVRTRVKEG